MWDILEGLKLFQSSFVSDRKHFTEDATKRRHRHSVLVVGFLEPRAGVPNVSESVEVELPSPERSFAQSKSASYGWWSFIRMLLGLMSSCLIYFECAKSRAPIMHPNQDVTYINSILGHYLQRRRSHLATGNLKRLYVSPSKTWNWTEAMWWWRSFCIMDTSLRTSFSMWDFDVGSVTQMTFWA